MCRYYIVQHRACGLQVSTASAGSIALQNATECSVALCSELRFPDALLARVRIAKTKNADMKHALCLLSRSSLRCFPGLDLSSSDEPLKYWKSYTRDKNPRELDTEIQSDLVLSVKNNRPSCA